MKKLKELATMLGMGGLDGSVVFAAIAGMFKPENALTLAVIFLAGPASITMAAMLGGELRERMLAAVLAGLIATVIVVFAAGVGPELARFVQLDLLKIFGGVAVVTIGLILIGIRLPAKLPTVIILLGVTVALLSGIMMR